MRKLDADLSSGPCHNDVLVVLGVCLHFNVLLAAGRSHGKAPYLCGEIAANLLLFCIEAHALADQMPTPVAPHVEGHLEADDKDPLVQLLGSLPQGVLPLKLQMALEFHDTFLKVADTTLQHQAQAIRVMLRCHIEWNHAKDWACRRCEATSSWRHTLF